MTTKKREETPEESPHDDPQREEVKRNGSFFVKRKFTKDHWEREPQTCIPRFRGRKRTPEKWGCPPRQPVLCPNIR